MLKGITMTLGDGKDYVIPPLTLGALEDFADEITALELAAGPEAARTIIAVVHRALVRNYPKLTIKDVSELLDMDNMKDVFTATMGQAGLVPRSAQPGEARAASPRKPRRR